MAATVVAGLMVTASSRMKAQDNSAAVQHGARSGTAAMLQRIETNRMDVVNEILSRWAGEIGTDEKAVTGYTSRFTTAQAPMLAAVAQASSWQQVNDILLGLTPGVNAFGSEVQDLVFNPVTPCRVLDTRLGAGAWHGPYNTPSTLSFYVTDGLTANGHTQGGAANCGFPFGVGTGVALNITVVATGADGDVKIWPYLGTEPNSSIVNFKGGNNVANAADVAIALNNSANDVTMKVEFATSVNYVVDIVGYFASPNASPLDTYRSDSTAASLANATASTYLSPGCVSGYSLTGGGYNFFGPSTNVWIWQSSPDENTDPPSQWKLRINNQGGSTASVSVYGVCARVHGR